MRVARMSSSFGCHTSRSLRSQDSQRIIMTGSTQAMSYISVSGPPGLRMRRRNPPGDRADRRYTPVILGQAELSTFAQDTRSGSRYTSCRNCSRRSARHASPFFVRKIVRRRTATAGGRQRASRVCRSVVTSKMSPRPAVAPSWAPHGSRSSRRSRRSRPSSGSRTPMTPGRHRRRPARHRQLDERPTSGRPRRSATANAMVVKIGTRSPVPSAPAASASTPVTSSRSSPPYRRDDDTPIAVQSSTPRRSASADCCRHEAGDPELGRTLLAVGRSPRPNRPPTTSCRSISDWPESGYLSGIVHAAALGDAMVANVRRVPEHRSRSGWQEFREGQWAQTHVRLHERTRRHRRRRRPWRLRTFDRRGSSRPSRASPRSATSSPARSSTDAEGQGRRACSGRRSSSIGVTLVAVLLAALMALFLTRSITRRVRAVSDKAHEVATDPAAGARRAHCATRAASRDPRGRPDRGRRAATSSASSPAPST